MVGLIGLFFQDLLGGVGEGVVGDLHRCPARLGQPAGLHDQPAQDVQDCQREFQVQIRDIMPQNSKIDR